MLVGPLFVAAAYLLGAIPFAYVVGRLLGVDLRAVGSRNLGAGNLTRSVGMGPGIAAAVLDGLKGLVPLMVAPQLGLSSMTAVVGGVAAVSGHNWSVYFRGRAGRGLATSVGVVVGLHPLLVLWPGIWAVAGWRIGGGIAGFVGWSLLPVVAAWLRLDASVVLACALLAVLMVVRRAQGNSDRMSGRGAVLHRILFDREPGLAASGEEELATP